MASTNDSDSLSLGKTNIPVLSAASGTSNFPFWKLRIESLLDGKNLLSIVDGSEPPPTDAVALAAYNDRKRKAYFILVDRLDDDQLASVLEHGKEPAAIY